MALKWAESDPASSTAHELAYRYMAFIMGSQREDGRWRNFMSFDRHWLEDVGSSDSQGRALWALGYCLHHANDGGMRQAAAWMIERVYDHALELISPRAVAFGLHGLAEVYKADHPTVNVEQRLRQYADYLVALFERHDRGDWHWFEDSLTYANATLPHALLVAADLFDEDRYHAVGQCSLDFLINLLFKNDQLDLIGQDGWYSRGSVRASYDQQPIDAQCMVEALLCAHQVLGHDRYAVLAAQALEWFYGRNRHGVMMYDETSGGCNDGLTLNGMNGNQGAESTLAHLIARLSYEETRHLTHIRQIAVAGISRE